MRHLDLFSGIGGFALAARNVWGADYENVGFCEINRLGFDDGFIRFHRVIPINRMPLPFVILGLHRQKHGINPSLLLVLSLLAILVWAV